MISSLESGAAARVGAGAAASGAAPRPLGAASRSESKSSAVKLQQIQENKEAVERKLQFKYEEKNQVSSGRRLACHLKILRF